MTRKMRDSLVVLVTLSSTSLLVGCGSSSSSSPPPTTSAVSVKFASLDGAQETPATGSPAVGGGVLAVNTTTGKMKGFVVTTAFATTPQAAHIHPGARGVAGGVLIPLSGVAGSSVWVVPDNARVLTAAEIAEFTAGNFYYNVHTVANTGGEIRGQLDKSGTAQLASLDGAQETPATGSTAVGGGVLAVDPTTGQVSGFLVTTAFTGTTSTAAHVHPGARGVAGGVQIPLGGVAGSSVWVVPDSATALSAADRATFTAGGFYYNVHTVAHTGGEIRGQLDKSGTPEFASLDGTQEVPPTASTAVGGGILAVNSTTGQVSGFLATTAFTGTSSTAAHVHPGARGVAGGVQIPLGGLAGSSAWVVPDGATALSAADMATFTSGGFYYNVHTVANTGGEIRGQIEAP